MSFDLSFDSRKVENCPYFSSFCVGVDEILGFKFDETLGFKDVFDVFLVRIVLMDTGSLSNNDNPEF